MGAPFNVMYMSFAGILAVVGLAAAVYWVSIRAVRLSSVRNCFHAFLRVDKRLQRKCRYCPFGRAHLHDETARVEDDDLVEVRCYVCHSCGLPQWNIERSPVLRKAA